MDFFFLRELGSFPRQKWKCSIFQPVFLLFFLMYLDILGRGKLIAVRAWDTRQTVLPGWERR